MDFLHGKQFHVYIANLTAKPANLPNFTLVAYVSSAPTGIIHARDDELHMLKDEGFIPTKCDKFNSDPYI